MLFSSFSTRSMVFAYFTKAQLPFFLFRDLFNDTAEFALCYGLHDCSHLFQGYFIHSLSTLYYYNAPSLTTRLTGDYRDRTYTGKCSPALLDTRKNKSYIQNISSGRSLPSMSQFYEICRYFDITPQEFFDERIHNLPLYQKANDLLKQLDEDDMMAVISILKRLTSKHP